MNDNGTNEITELGEACSQLLGGYERQLIALRGAVRAFRTALLARDQPRIKESVNTIVDIDRELDRLNASQTALREKLGKVFSIPSDAATVGQLVKRLHGSTQQRIFGQRNRLIELRMELATATRGIAVLVQQSIERYEYILQALSRSVAHQDRYTATGRPEQDVNMSLMQYRG